MAPAAAGYLGMRLMMTFLGVLTALELHAQSPAQRQQHYNVQSGIMLQGYDAVAYIVQQRAVKGSKQFAATHQGLTYYFATVTNRDLFVKNPAAYEPQYGGWCAYAMGATGEKVDYDPETFKVVGGKLYLFYNAFFTNTLPKWNKDEANLKAKADQHWAKFVHP